MLARPPVQMGLQRSNPLHLDHGLHFNFGPANSLLNLLNVDEDKEEWKIDSRL